MQRCSHGMPAHHTKCLWIYNLDLLGSSYPSSPFFSSLFVMPSSFPKRERDPSPTPGPARKRGRGSTRLSCAECRRSRQLLHQFLSSTLIIPLSRLKLRCDRGIPCSSCVKRGCGAICPDGNRTYILNLLLEATSTYDRL